MDPVRGLIHLGLRATETTLDRALGVVRLVDTLLVATAVPPVRERDADEAAWPDEEQADLDALSATLRARHDIPAVDDGATVSTAPATRTTAAAKKTAPVRKTAKKTAPVRKTAKKASASTAPAKKKAAATSPATKAAAKKAPAKKAAKTSPAKKAAKQVAPTTTAPTTAPTAETPTPLVVPDV